MKNDNPILKRHPNFLLVEEPGAPGDPSKGILPGTREATRLEYLLRDERERWQRARFTDTPEPVRASIIRNYNEGYALTEACLQGIRDAYLRSLPQANEQRAA